MNIHLALCLPQDGETVSVVRAVAMDALARFGVTKSCIDDIGLALSEACANVIRHADSSDEYEVRLEVDDAQCAICVIDTGRGLDVSALKHAMPGPASSGGRGVALMRALTDHIDFISEPQSGTIVRLVKKLSLSPEGVLARLTGLTEPPDEHGDDVRPATIRATGWREAQAGNMSDDRRLGGDAG